MRSRIAVEGDRKWRLPLMPDCLLEEGLGCGYIACLAEPEVDRLSTLVHRSIEIGPLAAYPDVGLINSPGAASGPLKAIPAFNELRCIPLHPSQDGGVSKVQSALRHHLDQIAKAELVAQIPAHAQDDHFAVEVPPSKQPLDAVQFAHRWPSTLQRPMYPTGRDRFAPEPLRLGVGCSPANSEDGLRDSEMKSL